MINSITKADYIRTFSGVDFTVFNPSPEQIDIIDIAHALSQICRYGGHSKTFYSVAQHSIAVSYLVKPENALCGLLHDATEAFFGDLPRPVKYKIPEYIKIENELYKNIAQKFSLPILIPDDVHEVDSLMITEYEWDYFMLKNPQEKHKEFYNLFFKFESFEKTKQDFLDRFYELQKLEKN